MSQNASLPASLIIVFSPSDNTDWFAECISSLLAQPFLPDQIILILNSLNLSFFENFIYFDFLSSLVVIETPSLQSFSTNLNLALKQVSHEYVFRLDPDDLVINNRFYCQYNLLIANPQIDICGSNVLSFRFSLQDSFHLYFPETDKDIKRTLFLNPIVHPSVCFKYSSISKLGFYREFKRSQDYDLWLRAFALGLIFYNIQEPLLAYRVPSQSIKRNLSACFTQSSVLFSNLLYSDLPKWWAIFCILFLLKPLIPITFWNSIKTYFRRIL